MMSIVAIFRISILLGMFVSAERDWQRRSMETLYAALESGRPLPQGMHRAPLFLAAADRAGHIAITENHIPGLTETEARRAVTAALAAAAASGKLEADSLRWLKRDQGGETRLAFVDISMEMNALRAQALSSLLIGVGALAVFFLASLGLARWMVRPVAQAWEEQRQFVADASHELKTPLTVVLSSIDMLDKHYPDTDANSRRWIDNIQAESLRIKKLVGALLDLARYDQGREKPALAKVDFSFLAKRGAMVFEPVIYERGLALATAIEEKLPVRGDEEKLRQLVDILLDNACKYSRPGGRIEVSLKKADKRFALLTVGNEGEPIPEKELRRIFRRFYRLDRARQAHGGYGLGLAIANSIVTAHQGRLWAESSPAGVNSFFAQLPLYK